MLRCREAVIPRYRSATRSTRQRLAQPLSINKEDIVGLAVDQGDRNFIPVLRQQVRIRRDVDFLNAYGALCGDGVDDLAGSVTQVTTRAGEQRDASGSHGRRNLLLVTTLNAGLLQQFAVLLLRHALTSLLNYGTHMSRSHFLCSHSMCGGLGYREFGVKIETDSALEVRAKTPISFELSTESTSP